MPKAPGFFFWLCGAACLLRPALGQAPNFAFSYRTAANANPVAIRPAGAIDLGSAAVGSVNTATFIIGSQDPSTWNMTVSVSGPPFQLDISGTTVIRPGESRLYNISFSPAAGGAAGGALNVQLSNGSRSILFTFFLSGVGLQPNLVCSYILAADGNQILVNANDSITFPSTQIGQASTAAFIISNTGTGPGTVTAVGVSGAAFKISGLPLLPAQVEAGKELRFTLVFSPTLQGSNAGSLQVVLGGANKNVGLSGQGIGAALVYSSIVNSQIFPVTNNGTVTLPAAAIGSSSSASFQIRNAGNAAGQVSAIAVTGAGFQLINLPFLPVNISPGESITFGIVFSPSQSGAAAGRLRIDTISINLSATGLGSSLSLSALQGGALTALADGGSITFPNTTVGTKSSAAIQITNAGNGSAQVNSVSVTGDAYLLASLPALPATLSPGQTLSFTVSFSPTALGAAGGTVRIDAQTIGLMGVGVAPPPLPAVLFGNVGDSAEPGQQPAISLSLASPYPLDIAGKLTITFISQAFVDDPAIQFSTGGRTVNFAIPANTTQAVFGLAAPQVQFQTGTVAGTIVLTSSFSAGAVNLTPSTAPAKAILIAPSPPRLRAVQIANRTANSFEVIVTGFSTPRSLSEMDLQFAAAPGSNLQTSLLTVNVDAPFSAWYQSGNSASFGSQFSAAITITVAGDVNAVQSVTVTAKNAQGTSQPLSAGLR
jgi:hypothetical protein